MQVNLNKLVFRIQNITNQSNHELKEYLKIELAPFSLLLFLEEGMRKGTKLSLYFYTTSRVEDDILISNNNINV